MLNQLQVSEVQLLLQVHLLLNHIRVPALLPPGSSSATTPGTSSVESTPGTSTGSCWVSVSTGGYGYETTVTICSDVTSGQSVLPLLLPFQFHLHAPLFQLLVLMKQL